MKIFIVGANGQVGKEIATIFTKWGHEVTALVRNPFGAAYFHIEGIEYIIGDIISGNEADEAIAQADAVIIAAIARGAYKTAVKVNEKIIRATIDKTQRNTCVYFFSSIRVFSRQIDRNLGRLDPLPSYDKEKAHSEKIFTTKCKKKEVRGRIFRLGHVIGYNQAKTEKFRAAIQENNLLLIDNRDSSNTVHTLTICDAILKTIESPDDNIIATLVNQPQWSWETLFQQIGKSDTVEFIMSSPSEPRSTIKKLVAGLLKILRPFKKYIKELQGMIGEKASTIIYFEKSRSQITNEIRLLNPEPCKLSEFAYKSAPGPFLKDLTDTLQLIDDYYNQHENELS